MQGTLGGYVADKERRVVYPVPGSVVEHELALKLENIFVQIGGKDVSILEKCANAKNFVNIIDRLGSISLHEVAMSEREDVAKFLCNRSDTCLDVVEGSGMSIRQLMMTSAITTGKVSRVLNKHTTKQVRKEERKERSRDICLNCQIEKAAQHCSNIFFCRMLQQEVSEASFETSPQTRMCAVRKGRRDRIGFIC